MHRKQCSLCHEYLPLPCFEYDPRGLYQRQRQCSKCRSQYQKKRHDAFVAFWYDRDPYSDHPTGEKTCARCRVLLAVNAFYRQSTNKDGLRGVCKDCSAQDRWTAKYGRIIEATDVCEVCNSTDLLGIDHNHATGATRGVLCKRCNTALGMFGESIDNLQRMITYLQTYEKGQ